MLNTSVKAAVSIITYDNNSRVSYSCYITNISMSDNTVIELFLLDYLTTRNNEKCEIGAVKQDTSSVTKDLLAETLIIFENC